MKIDISSSVFTTIEIPRDTVLPDVLAAFVLALQAAGFTYVRSLTAVCDDKEVSSDD